MQVCVRSSPEDSGMVWRNTKSGKELGSFNVFPDLIMMDGGRGQVNIALSVLERLGLFYSCMRYGKR